MKKNALDKISGLLATESLNRFEKAILNSILLYSKSAFTADPIEKIVYMLSALDEHYCTKIGCDNCEYRGNGCTPADGHPNIGKFSNTSRVFIPTRIERQDIIVQHSLK